MNDSGTIGHGYVIVTCHKVAFLPLLCGSLSGAGKERHIFLMLPILPHILFQDLVRRFSFLGQSAQYLVKQRFRHIIYVTVRGFYLHIGIRRIYAESHV